MINNLTECDLFIRGIVPWLGFRTHQINYLPSERLHGESKYSIRKMVSLAASGIIGSSIRPLRLSAILAALIAGLAGLYAIYALVIYFWSGHVVPGWASVVLAVCFIGSLQLLVLGVIGEYVGRILRESRKRPNFIVSATNLES